MNFRHIALAALTAISFSAHADTVALWDFNTFSCPSPCTAGVLPKATQSANGGTLSKVGAITFTSAGGSGTGNALNTSTYAGQGKENLSRGLQFMIDTSGYTDLVLTFDQRDSSSASAWTTLRYTVDGTTWQDAKSFLFPSARASASTPTFETGITFDFSSIAAANDNGRFGIQFLTSFAPDTTTYISAAAGTTTAYGTSGTIRYDNVLLSGTAIPDAPLPVPEPETYALMLAGLATVALLARRRRVL